MLFGNPRIYHVNGFWFLPVYIGPQMKEPVDPIRFMIRIGQKKGTVIPQMGTGFRHGPSARCRCRE